MLVITERTFPCCAGVREADINVAEGQRRARILASEAYQQEKVNQALGEANATLAKAEAQAKAIKMVADALAKKVSQSWSIMDLETLEKCWIFWDLIHGLEILEFYRVFLKSLDFTVVN